MRDFDYYKTKLPYPSEKIFDAEKQKKLRNIDNTALTKTQRDQRIEEVNQWVKESVLQLRKEYNIDEDRLQQEFYKDVEEELGMQSLPDAAKKAIHYYAYEQGHAYGFSSIYEQYGDLIQCIKDVLESFNIFTIKD